MRSSCAHLRNCDLLVKVILCSDGKDFILVGVSIFGVLGAIVF